MLSQVSLRIFELGRYTQILIWLGQMYPNTAFLVTIHFFHFLNIISCSLPYIYFQHMIHFSSFQDTMPALSSIALSYAPQNAKLRFSKTECYLEYFPLPAIEPVLFLNCSNGVVKTRCSLQPTRISSQRTVSNSPTNM